MRPSERPDTVNTGGGGLMDAVLIFLPGLKEIETLQKMLAGAYARSLFSST
jgi:HrpA-like RNA helicase